MSSAAVIKQIVEGLVLDFKAGRFDRLDFAEKPLAGPIEAESILGVCILSSGWNYKKSVAAMGRISNQMERCSCGRPVDIHRVAYDALNLQGMRHRFPKVRSAQLSASILVLWDSVSEGRLVFPAFERPEDLRTYIVSNYPGLGLKQASMFLRDAGISSDFGIIDRHISWYLESVEGFSVDVTSKSGYLKAEEYLRGVSSSVNVPMGVLDSIIWIVVSELKNVGKGSFWKEQSALVQEGSTRQLAFIY